MKIWEMPSGNVLTAVHCNHTAWQAAISIQLSATTQPSKVSAEWALIFLPYVLQQPRNVEINVVVIYRVLWCDVWQQRPRNRTVSRKTCYGWVVIAPSIDRFFYTDQNLMGFIINSDDSSSLCLAFVRANKMKGWHFSDYFRLISPILLRKQQMKKAN